MFDLHHLPMNFIPIYRQTSLVFPESNSYPLNLAEKTKSSKIWPQLIALERKSKNDPGLNAYFWRLGPSWKLETK